MTLASITNSFYTPLRLFKRLGLFLSMIRYGNEHNRDFAIEHYDFFNNMVEKLNALGIQNNGIRTLEIGCGKAYWLTLLAHSYGMDVTGIDTEYVSSKNQISKYLSIFRDNGLERMLRTLVWDKFYAASYYQQLATQTPFPLNFNKVDLRRMSSTDVKFPDNTFDLIVSHEVFEHIADIPNTILTLKRILKPSGITYIYVHNFTSLSGGHHIAWKYPDTEPSDIVPPWDHLREKRFPDIPSWLNGLRESEYKKVFEDHMDIIEWIPMGIEGEKLLTSDIRAELSDYDEKELVTKGFIIIAKPKPEIK
jgi:SAM-dependent methyltransferase